MKQLPKGQVIGGLKGDVQAQRLVNPQGTLSSVERLAERLNLTAKIFRVVA